MNRTRMLQKAKVLGLSVVATLALSSVIASAAQAGKFNAEQYPAAVQVSQVGAPTIWKMGAGIREISCLTSNQWSIMGAVSETLKLTPEFGGCTSKPGSTPVTIVTNECTYTWTVVTNTTGTEALNCPLGAELLINIYANASDQKAGKTLCEYGVPTQGPFGGLGFKNEGSGSTANVNVNVNVSGIKANSFKGPKLACGVAAGGSLLFSKTGALKATATKAGAPNGLTVG